MFPLASHCFWCRAAGQMTADHIISRPLWKYGRYWLGLEERSLKVGACRPCNEKRAAISLAFQLQCKGKLTDAARDKAKAHADFFMAQYERLEEPYRRACIYELTGAIE